MRQIDPKAEFNVQSKLRNQLEETEEPLQDPENHDKMIELKEKLWQLQHPGNKTSKYDGVMEHPNCVKMFGRKIIMF